MKLFFVFTSLLSLTFAQDYLCEGVEDNTRLPSTESCSLFYECVDGQMEQRMCRDGQYFDVTISDCDDSENVECYWEPTAPTPPGAGPVCRDDEHRQYFPSYNSCQQYYQCLNNTRWAAECPRGLYFDSVSLRCLPPSEAVCATRPSPPTLPPPGGDIPCRDDEHGQYFPSYYTCQQYYQCLNNTRWVAECPRGMYFDSVTLRCLPPNDAVCATRPTPPPIPPPGGELTCRDDEHGRFFPNYDFCHQYYQCLNNTRWLVECPRGLYFDSNSLRCLSPNDAACATKPTPPILPSPTPSPPGQELTCRDDEHLNFFPSYFSCQQYYQCLNNTRWLAECPRGLYFDSILHRCLSPTEAVCATRPTPPIFPTPTTPSTPTTISCENVTNFDFIASPVSCFNYYQCIDGKAFLLSCPFDQHFDFTRQRCDEPGNANCNIALNEELTPYSESPSCEGFPDNRMLRSQTSCIEYFVCLGEIAFRLSCPRGLYFEERVQTCVFPSESECVTTIEPPGTTNEPPVASCEGLENDQLIEHPTSCSFFYRCINGSEIISSCPVGRYFDINRQGCADSADVDCGGRTRRPDSTLTLTHTTTESTLPPMPSCVGLPDDRLLEHPTSCAFFFRCMGGVGDLNSCPINRYFDFNRQGCADSDDVNCGNRERREPGSTNEPSLTDCEGVEDNWLIEHPTSCALFYRCMGGVGVINSCPLGRYFDFNRQGCAESEDLDCGDRTRRPTSTVEPPIVDYQCQGVINGTFVYNINSCISYYHCIDGRAYPRWCDDGLWFDQDSQSCDQPELVNCAHNTIPTAPTESPDVYCRNQPDETSVPSPTYCEIFYICFGGVAYESECPPSEWFDSELRRCLPSDEVDCPLLTLPTTSMPTTTTDSSPEGLCQQARNGTYVGNRMSCGEYFVCIDSEPHGRLCQDGWWFNMNQQRCSPFSEVWCELDPIVCIGVGDNIIRTPASCSEFLTCENGVAFPGRCLHGDYFNEETQRCDLRQNVECDLEIVEEPKRGPCDGERDFGLVGSDDRCDEYFVCYHNEILFSLECPDNQIFDFDQQICGQQFECLL